MNLLRDIVKEEIPNTLFKVRVFETNILDSKKNNPYAEFMQSKLKKIEDYEF
ncbi:MAG: hypothetical protein U0354_15430 [Candidatus Sericytochromatia bacterium]